ncbi:hypothetical protein [Salipiger sp.]|uniref:hypothetical protein n=1 Tax=Salipiger sp. TaxID=2078585 RepID=UPI003A971EF0
MIRLVLLALLALPATARAACFGPGEALFHCTTNGGKKAVDICRQGEVVIYRFGPATGVAEMLLVQPAAAVGMTPWPGVGRVFWEEVTFDNDRYSYTVHHATDRMDASPVTDGGVTVAKDGAALATIGCDAGSVSEGDFYPVYLAKEAAGQVWCLDTQSWAHGCN